MAYEIDDVRAGRRDSLIYVAMTLISLTIGFVYIRILPIEVQGDASQYIETASALVGKSGQLYYYRTWGYPIFLILTGYPWLHGPIVTVLVQLILGSTIPYLIGSSLRLVGVRSWICILFAAVSLISLSPLILSASILSDQESQFLLYFVVWLMAWGLARTESNAVSGPILWKFASATSITFFCLSIVRPANAFLGLIALSVASVMGEQTNRKLMLRALFLLILLSLAWIPLQNRWVAWSEAKIGRTFQTDGSLAGAMFFWNIYSTGSTFVRRSVIRPQTGPCSSDIYESVKRNSSSVLADEVMAEHTLANHYIIWRSVEKDFGPRKMDRIFWCAAFEGIYAEPKSLLYIYDGLVSFFLISDVIYNDGYRQAWPPIDQYLAIPQQFGAWALYVGTGIKVVAFFIALLTMVSTYRVGGHARVLGGVVWAMLLYIAAVHVVFAAPHWRYSLAVIPGLVLLAGLGLSALIDNSGRKLKIDQ